MYVCERCGAKYSSARAAQIEVCPRCLLRSDVASPLKFMPAEAKERPERGSDPKSA
jgi:hypothetical protein